MNEADYTINFPQLPKWTESRIRKEKLRVRKHNRKARYRGLVATLTLDDWLDIIARYGDRCAHCGGEWSTLDHVTPMSWGAGTFAANCVPSCQECNEVRGLVANGYMIAARLRREQRFYVVRDLVKAAPLMY